MPGLSKELPRRWVSWNRIPRNTLGWSVGEKRCSKVTDIRPGRKRGSKLGRQKEKLLCKMVLGLQQDLLGFTAENVGSDNTIININHLLYTSKAYIQQALKV